MSVNVAVTDHEIVKTEPRIEYSLFPETVPEIYDAGNRRVPDRRVTFFAVKVVDYSVISVVCSAVTSAVIFSVIPAVPSAAFSFLIFFRCLYNYIKVFPEHGFKRFLQDRKIAALKKIHAKTPVKRDIYGLFPFVDVMKNGGHKPCVIARLGSILLYKGKNVPPDLPVIHDAPSEMI